MGARERTRDAAGRLSRIRGSPWFVPPALALGATPLQQIEPLVWVMLGLSVAGAAIVFAFLAYAIWRFRDPAARGRRHG